jgi:hypothetical protein
VQVREEELRLLAVVSGYSLSGTRLLVWTISDSGNVVTVSVTLVVTVSVTVVVTVSVTVVVTVVVTVRVMCGIDPDPGGLE